MKQSKVHELQGHQRQVTSEPAHIQFPPQYYLGVCFVPKRIIGILQKDSFLKGSEESTMEGNN